MHAPMALATAAVVVLLGHDLGSGARADELTNLSVKVDALVAPLIESNAVVGLIVGIRRGEEELFLSYGKVAKDKPEPPTADTLYEIGSITKAFTGVLLADASLRDGLKLDATVAESLPASAPKPAAAEQPITLTHLATHMSGLPRMPDDLKAKDPANPYADFTAADAYDFFAKHKLRREPGEYEYSNFAMGFLGQLLADRAGKSYNELVQERICKPLNMIETTLTLTPQQTARLAPPHDGDLRAVKNWDFQAFAGAGGLRSTARDMLKFAAAMLADDDRPVTKAFQLAGEPREKLPSGLGIGLGWHIARDGSTRWHNGQTGGYSSFTACLPKEKIAVIVLCNTATDLTTTLGEKIAQTAAGMNVDPPQVRKVVDVPVEVLKKYVGKYPLSLFFVLTVTLDGDQLMVQATGQDAYPIYPSSETEFYYRVVDAQISFVVNDKGEAEKLILHQNGVDQEGLRRK